MTDILLRPGEALRIEGGNGLSLVLRPNGDGWQIEFINPWWKRWLRVWRDAWQVQVLTELDEHILRDIGMHRGSADPIAQRVHALRERELQRAAMARLGLI